jgi:addiction module RelE/StbE family toxin
VEVRWTTPALAALAELQEYIAQDSPSAADRVTQRIARAVDDLANNPLRGRAGRVPGTRELIIPRTSHVAAYRVRGDVVEVLALVHQARLWPERFDDPSER